MDSRLAIVGAAGVAVAAVGLGWVLGRAGGAGAADSSTAAAGKLEAHVDRLGELLAKREEADERDRRSQDAMEAEMALLRRQLSLATSAAKEESKAGPVALRRQTSTTLDNGAVVELSAAEMERLQQIFRLFDEDNSGTIGADEIKRLHQRLGEAITDGEAATALKAMNAVDGQVSFMSFVKWWDSMHVTGMYGDRRKGQRYAARFKFLKAKLSNPEAAKFYTRTEGSPHLGDYRVHFFTKRDGREVHVSPWHDVPLRTRDGYYNFICEIPKWTRKKYEIATGEEFNPIKQDVDKSGGLREYKWGDMLFNYGAFPQTWEDPEEVSEHTGAIGDNDPIDVIELGGRSWPTGSIVRVKILGIIALIDSGETDWKVLVINSEDPLASRMEGVEDVRSHMPGAIEAITDWLRLYKSHKNVINEFAFDGECKDRAFAESIVEETHVFWKSNPGHGDE